MMNELRMNNVSAADAAAAVVFSLKARLAPKRRMSQNSLSFCVR